MDTSFKLRYFTRKALLTFFGPAHLDGLNDPVAALEHEREQRFGPRPAKSSKVHVHKRHFAHTAQHAA